MSQGKLRKKYLLEKAKENHNKLETYNKEFNLSEKRILVDEHFAHYPEENVREKIQNAQKRLKEYFKDKSGYLAKINKIFLEEFGDKLLNNLGER